MKDLKELVNKVNDNTLVHFEGDNHFLFIKNFIKAFGNYKMIKSVDKDDEGYIITVYKN